LLVDAVSLDEKEGGFNTGKKKRKRGLGLNANETNHRKGWKGIIGAGDRASFFQCAARRNAGIVERGGKQGPKKHVHTTLNRNVRFL